jgi:hypothetical protein
VNVLVIDSAGDRTAEEVFAHVNRLVVPEHIGYARVAGAGELVCPSILFDSGEGVFPTATPEGVLPLVMLTCDHFDWDAELMILTDDWTAWGGHVDRLLDHQQGDDLDAFYSFATECLVAPGGPSLAPLIDISGVAVPSLVWFREASRFYSLTQKAVRKDARVGGQFTFGSMVRELYLSHANVAYQCADARPLRALTRVMDPILVLD